MSASTLEPPLDSAPECKAVLFCPRCGHESGVDGDWRVGASAERYRVACPDCGEVVVTQPRY